MNQIRDSKDWPIAPGAWIRHLKRKGEVLKVEATEKHPEGVVTYRDAKSLDERLASAPTVTVKPPGSVAQDRYEKELNIPTSKRTVTRIAEEKKRRRENRAR